VDIYRVGLDNGADNVSDLAGLGPRSIREVARLIFAGNIWSSKVNSQQIQTVLKNSIDVVNRITNQVKSNVSELRDCSFLSFFKGVIPK
jgi:hypothetical protein